MAFAAQLLISQHALSDSDLVIIYDKAYRHLHEHYTSVSALAKHTLASDLDIKEQTNLGATIIITSYIAWGTTAENAATDCDEVFDETDYWYWGHSWGKCCEGGGENLDAADRLRQEINIRYPLPEGHMFFTELEDIYFNALLDQPFILQNPDDDVFDNYKDYRIFYNWSGGENYSYEKCLSPDEMDFYYCNLYDLIGEAMPVGKDFSHFDLFQDEETVASIDKHIFHHGYGTYGISNLGACGCIPDTSSSNCACW